MTRLDPSLVLSRLIVSRGGEAVYDESYRLGVNVIRGENASGKSTIANLIFYALGGHPRKWTDEALLCDDVIAEVLIGGESVTLRRELSGSAKQSISIFWGSLAEARESEPVGWQAYPYAAAREKQSFSIALFQALGVPQVRGELASRITMHQLLRLMYVDQLTPIDYLFMVDAFDREAVRAAVGSLLCGTYDDRLYDAQIELRRSENEFEQIDGKLKSIMQLLAPEGAPPSAAFVIEERRAREALREDAYRGLERLGRAESIADPADDRVRAIEQELRHLNGEVRRARETVASAEFESEDSRQFLESLRESLSALEDSETAREELGAIDYRFCPACLAPLGAPDNRACVLCKSEVQAGSGGANSLRLKRELSLQIQESEMLLRKTEEASRAAAESLPQLLSEQRRLQLRFDELSSRVATSMQAELAEAHRRIGYLDREIQDLDRRIRMAQLIEEMSQKKAELAEVMSRLADEIEALEAARATREAWSDEAIREKTALILSGDTSREFADAGASEVSFDFGKDRFNFRGKSNYAASSMVVLRNALHLGLLLASTGVGSFRYPRFVLMDNVEDKGMEVERSHNFQRLMIDASDNAPADHQIIFTTSMPAPEVEGRTIGDYYTADNKSLRIRTA